MAELIQESSVMAERRWDNMQSSEYVEFQGEAEDMVVVRQSVN